MNPQRYLPFVLLALFLNACAPKAPADQVSRQPKRVYFDANLEFSITIPEPWKRQFVRSPEGAGALYEVRWTGVLPELPGNRIEMEAMLLPPGALENVESSGLKDFVLGHPGFQLESRSQFAQLSFPASEAFGQTAQRSYLIFHIAAPKHLYRIAFSTPPEVFEHYLPLFHEIIESFTPLS